MREYRQSRVHYVRLFKVLNIYVGNLYGGGFFFYFVFLMPKFRVCVSQLEQLPPMQSRRANDKENEKAGAEVIGEGLFCDAGPPF